MTTVGMVEAYDFVRADSYTPNATAQDIPGCTTGHADGRVDNCVPGIGDYTLIDIVHIVPGGLTAGLIDPNGGARRIIVFGGAAVKDKLEASQQPRGGGTATDCYAFSAFADANLRDTPAGRSGSRQPTVMGAGSSTWTCLRSVSPRSCRRAHAGRGEGGCQHRTLVHGVHGSWRRGRCICCEHQDQ